MLQLYVILQLSVCDRPPDIYSKKILESASTIPRSETIKKSHASRHMPTSYPSRGPCKICMRKCVSTYKIFLFLFLVNVKLLQMTVLASQRNEIYPA